MADGDNPEVFGQSIDPITEKILVTAGQRLLEKRDRIDTDIDEIAERMGLSREEAEKKFRQESNIEVEEVILEPITLLIDIVKQKVSSGGKNTTEYVHFRDNVVGRFLPELSLEQRGKVVMRIIRKGLPSGLFEFNQGRGLSYLGGLDNGDILEEFQKRVSPSVASHILLLFQRISKQA